MKPRWKSIVELIAACIITLVGGYMVADAMSGGDLWKWVGILVIWNGLDHIHSSWKEI